MQIKKNLICVMVAAATGAGLGAVLGYGPLLRYKADGVLKIGLDTAEYKRVADLARDPHNLSNYAAWSPPPDSNRAGVDHFVRALGQQSWMTPIPTVSKADEREVPDIFLQREHDKLVNGGDRGRVYLGVELAYTAADPSEAANGARWLGAYFKDAATLEGLRQVVSEWAAESAEFSERATERRLKARFDIEQAEARADAFKKIVSAYPEAARRDVSQVIDVRQDNERFMSPMAQLVGAQSEVIGLREQLRQLDRQIDQHAIMKELVVQVQAAMASAHSGGDALEKLTKVVSDFDKKSVSEAQHQKISAVAVQIDEVASRFETQPRFLSQPSEPTSPERPSPHMLIVLAGVLAAFVSAIFLWRDAIHDLLSSRMVAVPE